MLTSPARYSVLLSEPAGKSLTGHQSTIYWVPWCLSPSLFHSGKQDIFRLQIVCCRDDLSQSHLSEWAKGECFGSGFIQLQSVCLSCLHGFGGAGDGVTDEVMFCFQSAGRKERNKDQNSETRRLTKECQSKPRKRKGWRITWVVCDVPKLQKTKLEHSVGKNIMGRLSFKEIHTEPHSPTNYNKNSISREQQTKLSSCKSYI